MWTNKDPQPGPSDGPVTNSLSSSHSSGRQPVQLGASLKIKGEITGNEDLRLDSQFEGSISLGGFRLTIGPSSHVDGEIVAREVVVLGEVTGNISARDKLEIKKGSTVVGDLSTARIMIEEGAYFKGAIEIDTTKTQVGADLDTLLSKAK
jgi:cytoskeletal protein CcmA (bactofilin family)